MCPRLWSPSPAAAEAPRWVRSRGSHIDLADGLETGPPYFHLYSPGLALSRDTHSFCDDLAGGENSLWGGSFHLRSSQHLPRCRWGGAVAVLADGLDGKIKTGNPLSSFPIRSSVRCNALCSRRARSEECVRAYDLAVPRLLRHRGEWDHRAHIDLADGLETGSPYFHLYSPGLALSRGGSLSCSSSPLSESALICSSFSPRRFICFVPSGSRVAEGYFSSESTRRLRWSAWAAGRSSPNCVPAPYSGNVTSRTHQNRSQSDAPGPKTDLRIDSLRLERPDAMVQGLEGRPLWGRAVYTTLHGARLSSVPSGDQSANPASVLGHSGLQRALLSVSSAQKCSGDGRLATPSGVSRAARSAVPCWSSVPGHRASRSKYTRGQSQETGSLSKSPGGVGALAKRVLLGSAWADSGS